MQSEIFLNWFRKERTKNYKANRWKIYPQQFVISVALWTAIEDPRWKPICTSFIENCFRNHCKCSVAVTKRTTNRWTLSTSVFISFIISIITSNGTRQQQQQQQHSLLVFTQIHWTNHQILLHRHNDVWNPITCIFKPTTPFSCSQQN